MDDCREVEVRSKGMMLKRGDGRVWGGSSLGKDLDHSLAQKEQMEVFEQTIFILIWDRLGDASYIGKAWKRKKGVWSSCKVQRGYGRKVEFWMNKWCGGKPLCVSFPILGFFSRLLGKSMKKEEKDRVLWMD
ncbi:hypothetical protein CK203_067017 [Vitis vinifera]|uniref:Uncharacterized protein n=1 Tax=Vitis vinifera TaxID=29760 RepID=A0A438F5C9_VITVI|nr:hypothetical protein CK203_067017 [Vitis vinifera]